MNKTYKVTNACVLLESSNTKGVQWSINNNLSVSISHFKILLSFKLDKKDKIILFTYFGNFKI